VIEFLHRIVDILVEYFGEVSEISIRDNFDVVYQVRLQFELIKKKKVFLIIFN
jgi:hypothetical protein